MHLYSFWLDFVYSLKPSIDSLFFVALLYHSPVFRFYTGRLLEAFEEQLQNGNHK